jgi:lipopolysaccharide biosynthesis protein
MPHSVRRALRGGAKLGWWTVTLRLPSKLRERNALLQAQADQTATAKPMPEEPSVRSIDAVQPGTAVAPSKQFRLHYPGWLPPLDRPEFAQLSRMEPQGRIAVVVHIYYKDLWSEISPSLKNIEEPFDLFVTLVVGVSNDLASEIKKAWPFARILNVDNHGRDILPFLCLAKTGILSRYEFICKLHTKRSPWHEDGDRWRQGLIEGVLGNSDVVRRILFAFRADPNLGMVVGDGQMFSGRYLWLGNAAHLTRLFERFGMDEREFDKSFAGGSIFWIRSCLLQTVSELPVEFDDFEPEPIGNDGSLAHAIERLISLICYEADMVIRETGRILAATEVRRFAGNQPGSRTPSTSNGIL